MQQKNASIIRVGWMVLIVLLSGRAANSQNFVGDAGTRALRRGLATSSTNICPDEAEACLDDSTCLTCFEKPESTACVSEYLDGDLTCDAVFSGYICCEYEDEASCVGNTLLLELFGEREKCGRVGLFGIKDLFSQNIKKETRRKHSEF